MVERLSGDLKFPFFPAFGGKEGNETDLSDFLSCVDFFQKKWQLCGKKFDLRLLIAISIVMFWNIGSVFIRKSYLCSEFIDFLDC